TVNSRMTSRADSLVLPPLPFEWSRGIGRTSAQSRSSQARMSRRRSAESARSFRRCAQSVNEVASGGSAPGAPSRSAPTSASKSSQKGRQDRPSIEVVDDHQEALAPLTEVERRDAQQRALLEAEAALHLVRLAFDRRALLRRRQAGQ